jgi:hypothetical protein
MRTFLCLSCLLLLVMVHSLPMYAGSGWQIPADAPLLTPWAAKVDPAHPLPEYPRPIMTRKEWLNLNGLWGYELPSTLDTPPVGKELTSQILVPYPVESALSGVMKRTERIWYRRTFAIPKSWAGKNVLLHFGAIDWESVVFVNGARVGTHRGGYDPFSLDITKALKPGGEQEIVVGVYDPADGGDQPRGKQVRKPGGIWYTPCTGIWQTVWCEPVPATAISNLHVETGNDASSFVVTADVTGDATATECIVTVMAGKKEAGKGRGTPGQPITIPVRSPKRWSPDTPFLYDLRITLVRNGKTLDAVGSYGGLRTITLARDARGVQRLMLNGEPCFQAGPLDQGFWPDGIYTAPTDAALRYDIEITKELGFNMTRKHVKVEPARWYYWADRLGLLVWQDMPSGNNKTPEGRVQFEKELDRLVATHRNHPSIIMWVVFNEGWGQYDTERLTAHVKHADPNRLVNNASGWADKNAGDVMDIHSYPKPEAPIAESRRAVVLGEFGGLGLAVSGHTWQKEHWGYRGMKDSVELTSTYEQFLVTVRRMKETDGLCAAVYTQITDVEVECNGLMTYDRLVVKAPAVRIAEANRQAITDRPLKAAITLHPVIQPVRDVTGTDKPPLVKAPLARLPIGSIRPQGWLRKMLEIERDGMVGHLAEISPWLDPSTSAWASSEGKGSRGWEELPYWLKGYGDLGYVLGDTAIQRKARLWIEAMLSSQRDDGWFGPRELLTSLDGKPDLWPHMVMLNVLQSYFEYTADPRVIPFMQRYFAWEHTLPETAFGAGYWPKLRMGDNIESVLWLYNRTATPWLLDLAGKMHRNMSRWDSTVINWHNVNVAQGFRAPAMYYPVVRDFSLLQAAERNYRQVREMYGQFPGGGFAADENARPGFIDPRQGFETCGIVEFMHSFEMLTRVAGGTVWSDRCEELAFNSLPVAMTPDQKGLHYLTCANQVQLDKGLKTPGIQNGGTMFSYSPFQTYRCCQHNVAHGWPYFAEEMWLASRDGGLCASLYAPSQVRAAVGGGIAVGIEEQTGYPFDGTVRLTVTPAQKVRFPLYLRIPGWCPSATVSINGTVSELPMAGGMFACIDRTWAPGDEAVITFAMPVQVQRWEKNQNAVSVNRGPLSFSLSIGERWEKYGTNASWPEWEVYPTTAWNYGLMLDTIDASRSFTVEPRTPDPAAVPWSAASLPFVIKGTGMRIDGWQVDYRSLIGPLQKSPARTSAKEETLTLVPMGSARLRISAFPTVRADGQGTEWVPPQKPRPIPFTISYSYINRYEDPEAIADGFEPKSSNDEGVTRMSWWDHKGTAEWIQYDLPAEQTVSTSSVYWFDDGVDGFSRVPQSWQILYRDGDAWLPVETPTAYATEIDTFNVVKFKPVKTSGLRLQVQLQKGYSSGVLEWKFTQ